MKDKTIALLVAILVVFSVVMGHAWSKELAERWQAGQTAAAGCRCGQDDGRQEGAGRRGL